MPSAAKYATRSSTRQFIYVFALKKKEFSCIKIGKCTGSPWNRVRRGQLKHVVCPRKYKKEVAEPTNLRLLHCFGFPQHVDVHATERLFHRRHREMAQCGEWYPADQALARLQRFVEQHRGYELPSSKSLCV